MAGKNPFLTMDMDYDFTVLNHPNVFFGVIFWHGIATQPQAVRITVETSVLIDDVGKFQTQVLGLLVALQYIGIHVDLPYSLIMGQDEMHILVEKD